MAEGRRIERVQANLAARFQRGTLPLGQPSTEESGRLERQPVDRIR
jgi:hypothetical protein